jgi:hypothetical protein
MDILNKVKEWAGALAEVGVSLAALAIIMEVLGMGNVPFMPEMSVVDNVSAMLASLGSQGVMGLIAIWVLWGIWNRK